MDNESPRKQDNDVKENADLLSYAICVYRSNLAVQGKRKAEKKGRERGWKRHSRGFCYGTKEKHPTKSVYIRLMALACWCACTRDENLF